MEIKKYPLIIVLLLVFSISLIAAHVLTPSTYEVALGYSFNESIEINVINITVNNTQLGASANITQVNITIPSTFTFINGTNETNAVQELFENTTTELSWTNSTIFLINGTAGDGELASFWFNTSASTPGNYNITVTTVMGNGTTLAQNISIEINDTTAPFNVSFDTGTPATNVNLSQSYIVVNITANDTDGAHTTGLNEISIAISNSSGVWNTTITSTNSDTITFTGLVDGVYYINATANDTAGNTNSTGTGTRTITLDTTNPGATASCTPSSLVQNAVETCTCTGTDTGGSGVATSSATTTPPTASTGTYYYTCTVTDNAGNSAASTTSFEVTGTSNGPGGSGTTSFWTKGTQTVTDEQFAESYTKALSVRQRVKVKVETLNHYIGVIELTATTATINVSSEPQQAILIIGDERRFEVSGDEYYDILVKLNSIENNKANITVQSIYELVTVDTTEGEEELEEAGDTAKEEEATKEGLNIWWIVGIVVLILIIVGIIYAKKK